MAEIKLTKNELRDQQVKLIQLRKYLPTLQLKKAMLQSEVNEVRLEIDALEANFVEKRDAVYSYAALLTAATTTNPLDAVKIRSIGRRYENIAGVEIPYYEGIEYEPFEYTLIDTPPWLDSLIITLKAMKEAEVKASVAREKKAALEKELREVSIRVNLFEKIMIPRAQSNIRKIKVFLGDQQLAAVSQAKVAKGKIEANKAAAEEARG